MQRTHAPAPFKLASKRKGNAASTSVDISKQRGCPAPAARALSTSPQSAAHAVSHVLQRPCTTARSSDNRCYTSARRSTLIHLCSKRRLVQAAVWLHTDSSEDRVKTPVPQQGLQSASPSKRATRVKTAKESVLRPKVQNRKQQSQNTALACLQLNDRKTQSPSTLKQTRGGNR